MGKGYQILEAGSLDPVLRAFKHSDLLIAIEYWLIDQLYAELKDQLAGVELEVIKVEYYGAYPAIGVHYTTSTQDLQPLLETTIDRLLRERPLYDLIQFLETHKIDWAAEDKRIMSEGTVNG